MPVTTEAMRLLLQYHWPGNVRQLEAVLQQAVLPGWAEDRLCGLADRGSVSTLGRATETATRRAPPLPSDGIDLEAVEREFILQAMEQSGWVIAKAAKLLGLSYRTLQYRLEKFQIRRDGSDGVESSDVESGGAIREMCNVTFVGVEVARQRRPETPEKIASKYKTVTHETSATKQVRSMAHEGGSGGASPSLCPDWRAVVAG
jgi:hypothetical protein